MVIPRPRPELGRHSLWYRPVIWNFLNKIINVPYNVNSLKTLWEKYQSWLGGLFFQQRSIGNYNEIKGFYLFLIYF